jgi:PhnB protein
MSTAKNNSFIQPYLFFNGSCEAALEFYRKALGAEVEMLMRFKESPEPHPPDMLPPGFENKIMHCSFRVGTTTLMASDGCSADKANFDGFSLSLTVSSEAEADRVFAALAEGGKVRMPLAKTFWSPHFGMVQDRFGIGWMISVMLPGQPFVISRTFDAPRDKVWKAWTDRDQLRQWFGPKGMKMTTAKLDFRQGGSFLYCLQNDGSPAMWGKFVYRVIEAPHRIVLVNSFSDEKGGVTRYPFAPTWPMEMLSTTTLAEEGGKTKLTIEWSPLNPTDEERKTFETSRDGMKQGWTGTFDQLDAYLAKA